MPTAPTNSPAAPATRLAGANGLGRAPNTAPPRLLFREADRRLLRDAGRPLLRDAPLLFLLLIYVSDQVAWNTEVLSTMSGAAL
jgi:hypothetical protein